MAIALNSTRRAALANSTETRPGPGSGISKRLSRWCWCRPRSGARFGGAGPFASGLNSMEGGRMGRRLFGTYVTISFEPVEDGWTQARTRHSRPSSRPPLPREEARDAAIDALMEVLAVEPTREKGAEPNECTS